MQASLSVEELELSWSPWDEVPVPEHKGILCANPMAILVLDDDPLFGELFVDYVRRDGHYAVYFTSLEDMGSLNKLRHFHAALVDYDLGPNLNGLEAADLFKANFDLPVILTSATRVARENRELETRGIEGFIRKQDGLKAILNTVISHAKKRFNA